MSHDILWHDNSQYHPSSSVISLTHVLFTKLDFITDFYIITKFREVSREHLQRLRLVCRGRLLLWIPSLAPFGTRICFHVKTSLSFKNVMFPEFEYRTSLGTSISLSHRKILKHVTTFSPRSWWKPNLWSTGQAIRFVIWRSYYIEARYNAQDTCNFGYFQKSLINYCLQKDFPFFHRRWEVNVKYWITWLYIWMKLP